MDILGTSLLTLVTLLATITLPVPSVLSQEEQEGKEEQQWLTYEDPDFGYSIQYPSDWEEGHTINPVGENTSDKSFRVPEKYPKGAFTVEITPLEKYLDPDTLTLKTTTFHDLVRVHIQDINSDPILELHKNISTTIGQNHYPAVQMHFSETPTPDMYLRTDSYWIDTLMVKDGYAYLLRFFAPPLNIPELLPTVEKMLASLHITK